MSSSTISSALQNLLNNITDNNAKNAINSVFINNSNLLNFYNDIASRNLITAIDYSSNPASQLTSYSNGVLTISLGQVDNSSDGSLVGNTAYGINLVDLMYFPQSNSLKTTPHSPPPRARAIKNRNLMAYLRIVPMAFCFSASVHSTPLTDTQTATDLNNIKSAANLESIQDDIHFQPPDTPKAVLLNFKYALEQSLFLKRDFYTPENIKWFLGAYKTQPSNQSDEDIRLSYETIESPNYRSCIEKGLIGWNDDNKTRMQLQIKEEGAPSISVGGGILGSIKNSSKPNDPNLIPICAQFNADTMQDVFGEPTEIEDASKYEVHAYHREKIGFAAGPETHIFGNKIAKYIINIGKNTNAGIKFYIIGNGMITGFSFHLLYQEK
jgi:hypothetical protein